MCPQVLIIIRYASLSISGTTVAKIVWTDNKKFVLGIRCLGLSRIWSLKSTEPDIDDESKELIMKKIKEFGFKPELAFVWPNAGCSSDIDVPEPKEAKKSGIGSGLHLGKPVGVDAI
jgi:hypothetical protein